MKPSKAELLKFGDPITMIAASEGNPLRYCYFVRRGNRTGRMNAGPYIECTDMMGKFWTTPVDNIAYRESLPDEPAPSPTSADHIADAGKKVTPSPTKPDGLEWLATALKNRNIDVSGASSSAVAAIVALDHYRGEREGNPLANVSSLSPVSDADTVRVKREDAEGMIELLATLKNNRDATTFTYTDEMRAVFQSRFDRLRASVSGGADV